MEPKLYIEWPSNGKPLIRATALEGLFQKLVDAIDDKHKASRALLELKVDEDDTEIHQRLDDACARIEAIAEVIGKSAVQFGWKKGKSSTDDQTA
jgi:hypothetical protein